MKAEDVADAAVCVKRSDTLGCARNLMLRHKTRKLVVVEGGVPVGVLSAKDMLPKLKGMPLWKRRPVGNALVGTAMTRDPLTARSDAEASEIARMMVGNRISSVPIIAADGSLSGIVTKEGILRAFVEAAGRKPKVSSIMAKKVFSVDRMHTLSHVRNMLVRNGIGRVVVKANDAPVGMITATDLMFAEMGDSVAGIKVRRKNIFRRSESAVKERVEETQPLAGDIMADAPVTVREKDDAKDAAGLMLKHKVSGLPVVGAGGNLVGIVTKTDILRAFLELGSKGRR